MQLEKMARKFQKRQTDLNREVPTIRNQILNKIYTYSQKIIIGPTLLRVNGH